jgi:hypothetical protein
MVEIEAAPLSNLEPPGRGGERKSPSELNWKVDILGNRSNKWETLATFSWIWTLGPQRELVTKSIEIPFYIH